MLIFCSSRIESQVFFFKPWLIKYKLMATHSSNTSSDEAEAALTPWTVSLECIAQARWKQVHDSISLQGKIIIVFQSKESSKMILHWTLQLFCISEGVWHGNPVNKNFWNATDCTTIKIENTYLPPLPARYISNSKLDNVVTQLIRNLTAEVIYKNMYIFIAQSAHKNTIFDCCWKQDYKQTST